MDRAAALGELEIESCSRLLEVFFKHVHIKNPVLDEKLIRQWARGVCLDGIAWNAQSCLVVGSLLSRHSFNRLTDKVASRLRFGSGITTIWCVPRG